MNPEQARGGGTDSPQSPANGGESVPTTEVEYPRRRSFSAAYKRQILEEVEAAPHGGIGPVLRREGLTHAHLQSWRAQFRRGALAPEAVAAAQAERQSKKELQRENRRLQRENERLKAEAEKQAIILDYQRRLAKLLGESTARETPS